MLPLIFVIDQGTTGTHAAFFNSLTGENLGQWKVPFPQHYPQPGWVEHCPEDLWSTVWQAFARAWEQVKLRHRGAELTGIEAVAVTNQRETCLAWHGPQGTPLERAIVWQDRRTAPRMEALKAGPQGNEIWEKTGLLCDPYFSASKWEWLLAHSPSVQGALARGDLKLGTVDSFLIYRLTGGKVHATDHTNASRTLLYNLKLGSWDPALCDLFGIPLSSLPHIVPSVGAMGTTGPGLPLPEGVPIVCCLGDQQSALYGQDMEAPGQAKITFGTGAFLLAHTGQIPHWNREGLLSTVAFSGPDGRTFALEGSAFIAGAAVQFAQEQLGWIGAPPEIEDLATRDPRDPEVVFVPALAGFGAPYWNPHARGTWWGLTRGTTKSQMARAILESVAFQNVALLQAMARSGAPALRSVSVDGGAAANRALVQWQADALGVPVSRPAMTEATARGAARGAALWLGTAPQWRPLEGETFLPHPSGLREGVALWERAAKATHNFYTVLTHPPG